MWIGDFPASFATVPIFFTTHAADGSPVAPNSAFEAADVLLYKDGNATQRTSTNGWTMTSPFDSVTGLHRLLIDLSDNTDAGFYAVGHVYTAVLSPDETVASEAVVKVIGQFGIGLSADGILDEVVEGSTTMRQMLRLFASALGGKLSGAATTTVTIRDIGDTKDRITATVDSDGNRTAVTLDGS